MDARSAVRWTPPRPSILFASALVNPCRLGEAIRLRSFTSDRVDEVERSRRSLAIHDAIGVCCFDPLGQKTGGALLRALRIIGIAIGVLALDAGAVFVEFAGSGWLLPWLNRANPIVMEVAAALLLFLIPRRCRQVAVVGLAACAMFFAFAFVAASFVIGFGWPLRTDCSTSFGRSCYSRPSN